MQIFEEEQEEQKDVKAALETEAIDVDSGVEKPIKKSLIRLVSFEETRNGRVAGRNRGERVVGDVRACDWIVSNGEGPRADSNSMAASWALDRKSVV